METSYLWVNLLLGLFLSGFCLRSSVAFPSQHVSSQLSQGLEAPVQLNTVRLSCHPDTLEVVIEADMFGVGAPVDSSELHLGVERSQFCTATASSRDEYSIIVGLADCGTKHWVMVYLFTADQAFYTLVVAVNVYFIHR